MSTMSETASDSTRPQGRVALLRRHGGYAVCVVIDEGPYSRLEAQLRAAHLSPPSSDTMTKAQAAQALGISRKGVDYLRSQGVLTSEKNEQGRVLIHTESINAELERRGNG